MSYNDDNLFGVNFGISYTLEAGETYYYCTRELWSDGTGYYSVKLTAGGMANTVSSTEIDVDSVETVTVTASEDSQTIWYSFTPDTSGTYVFASSGNDVCDVDVTMYYETEDGDFYSATSTYGGMSDFSLAYYLEANVTYYYRTIAYGTSNVGSFTVSVSESDIEVISSITSVSPATSTFETAADIDFTGTEVTVAYGSGSTNTLTIGSEGCVYDQDSDTYIYIYCYSGYSYNTSISDYTISYDAYAYVYSGGSSSYYNFDITVNDSGSLSIPLTLGVQSSEYETGAAESYIIFSFTPDTDGTYYFVRSVTTDSDDYYYYARSYLRYYYEEVYEDGTDSWMEYLYPNYDEDGNYEYYEDTSGNTWYYYDLKAGTTYYYIIDDIMAYDDEPISFSMTAYAESDTPATTVDLSTCSVTLSASSYTYDGTAKTPAVTVKDANGNTVSSSNYTVKYENNTNVGTAKVTITGTGSYTGTITKTFTIDTTDDESGDTEGGDTEGGDTEDDSSYGGSSVSEAQALTLDTSYNVEIAAAGDVAWFSYTPAESGVYVFTSTDNLMSDGEEDLDTYVDLYTYDSEGELIEVGYNDDGGSGWNFSVAYQMTAGTTYYYCARALSSSATGSFMVMLSQSDVKLISSISDVNTDNITVTYTDGSYSYSGVVITLTYTDGTTNTLTVNGGNSVYDEQSDTRAYIYMDGWTYFNTNSLQYKYCYEPYVYIDTLSGGKYYDIDNWLGEETLTMVSMTTLGQEYSATDPAYGYAYFSFTPDQSGTYYFVNSVQTDSEDYYCSPRTYLQYCVSDGEDTWLDSVYPNTDTNDEYITYEDENGKTYYIYQLEAGVTYYYTYRYVETYDGKSITVGLTPYAYSETADTYTLASASLATTSYTYDGKAKTPAVTVKDANGNTVSSSNYTVKYENNTNVGTAKVTITGTGSYTGTITKTFSITKASQSVSASIASSSIKAGESTTITASGTGTITYATSNETVATVDSNGKVTGVGVGTATITVKAAGNSNYNSATKTVTVTVGLATPAISSIKQSNKTVTVTWSKVAGAKGYYVYRSTSKTGTYTQVATITSGDTVSYKDTASKSNGKTYYYKVTAVSGNTKSADSAVKDIKYMKASVSSLTNTSKGITVKWKKVSGATGYYIYRKTGSGSYKKVKTITKGSTVSWTDTSVKSKNGTTYTYYVQPYNSTSKGAYATKKTVRLTAVSISSLKNSASKTLTVKYKKNSKATGYQIQYSTSKTFTSSKTKSVTVTKSSTLTKKLTKLTKGKTYYVRVRAYKKVGSTKYYSAWSAKKSKKVSK